MICRLQELPRLADKILQDYPNITRLLDKLEKNGFVQREDDKNNRRNFIIKLSAKGRESFERIIPLIKKEREQLLKGISLKESIVAQEIINRNELPRRKQRGIIPSPKRG